VLLNAAELAAGVNPFTLHLYAALAEKEGQLIADQTKAMLPDRKKCDAMLGKLTVGRLADRISNSRRLGIGGGVLCDTRGAIGTGSAGQHASQLPRNRFSNSAPVIFLVSFENS
jgi:hypothetical protein